VARLKTKIQVQTEKFCVGSEYDELRSSSLRAGAVVTFSGTVRDLNEDKTVQSLYLEHYPEMTERALYAIAADASQKWDLIAVTIIHRVGKFIPGDEIVFVGIASQHRETAFASCAFVMDYLKTRATFWKKERTGKGERWLTTRASDLIAEASWEKR
jgi:molybdopterin synthase catalytic subunit